MNHCLFWTEFIFPIISTILQSFIKFSLWTTFENLTIAENFIDPDSNTFWTKGSKKKDWLDSSESVRKGSGLLNSRDHCCHQRLSTSLGHRSPELHSPASGAETVSTRDPSPSHSGHSVPWGRASSSESCWDLSCWAGTAGSGSCPRGRAAGWEGSWGSPGNTGAAHLSPAKHTERSA